MKPLAPMQAILVVALALASTVSLAQVTPTPPPIAPPAGAAPPPPAAAPVPAPGMRIATGQAAVVGGNSAAARDRALEDAIKQAVDAAVTGRPESRDPRRPGQGNQGGGGTGAQLRATLGRSKRAR